MYKNDKTRSKMPRYAAHVAFFFPFLNRRTEWGEKVYEQFSWNFNWKYFCPSVDYFVDLFVCPGAATGFWVGLGAKDFYAREARELFFFIAPPQIGKKRWGARASGRVLTFHDYFLTNKDNSALMKVWRKRFYYRYRWGATLGWAAKMGLGAFSEPHPCSRTCVCLLDD